MAQTHVLALDGLGFRYLRLVGETNVLALHGHEVRRENDQACAASPVFGVESKLLSLQFVSCFSLQVVSSGSSTACARV